MFLIFLVGVNGVFSQQNEFFKNVKEYFDGYEKELESRFQTQYFLVPEEQKSEILEEYNSLKERINNARNDAYLDALVKTKIATDLHLIEKETIKIEKKNKKYNSEAAYPTGISGLREEVAQKFYIDAISAEGDLSTTLVFVVDTDGSLASVESKGEHVGFNRQAEIALYLLSERFIPAYRRGIPVKSIYRFPLKMRFE